MKALAKPSVVAVSIFIFSLVFGISFYFLIIPQVKISAAQQATLHQLLSAPVPTPPSKSDSSASTDTADQALTLIPDTDGQYDLTIQIEALMKGQGLPITSLSVVPQLTAAAGVGPAALSVAPTAKLVNVSVSTTGSYASIQKLVQGLVGLNRFIDLNQVDISSSSTVGSPTDNLSVQITAYAFYLPSSTTSTPTP